MSGCHVMAKPASSRCNLDCHYCFYNQKTSHPVMNDDTLSLFILQHIAAQSGNEVQFAWQGGEPTLCGLSFFRRVINLQQQYASGKHIQNTLQTNGILLNDEWCQFFHQHQWLVGLSLDGPARLHDTFRQTRSGKPTHGYVQNAINCLSSNRVEFNILTVVNRQNSQYPGELYHYLRQQGTPFIQFIPLVEFTPAGELTSESVTSEEWGKFLCEIFDIWSHEDIGHIFIQLFDSTLGVWCGFASQMCVFSETCGHAFALEANGDIFQCDHYVYPEYLLGNIHHLSLETINNDARVKNFGLNKKHALSTKCLTCRVRTLCHGDCPKHRVINGESALCGGYQTFFTHSASKMRAMRDLIVQGRSPAELMI